MRRGKVLVVDDKPSMLHMLERTLTDRFDVVTAADGAAAARYLAASEHDVDVVLTDLRMPGKDGMELLRLVKETRPTTEVILMTAFGSVQTAVEAMHRGAFDYLAKPFEPDEAVLRVAKAVEHKLLKERVDDLADAVGDKSGLLQLRGKSAAMKRVFALLEKAAQPQAQELTVLITGPSGTGKELAARAIHALSPRKAGPFVAINCGALPADLIESELFGHKKGAFTGALEDKAGLVEEAAKGTLFLDEIGDLPLPLQVKLNRALQEREFRRVGETKDRRVEARIVAATNADLKQRVAEGRFREDLMYRLRVFEIAMPPLVDRRDDIPLLAELFRARAAARAQAGARSFSQSAMHALATYAWPGNVRELENAVERAVAVADEDAIALTDLPQELVGPATKSASASSRARDGELEREREPGMATSAVNLGLAELAYRDAMDLVREQGTRDYLVALMTTMAGNVSRAAERAGIARESLHRLLKKHDIDPDRYRTP